MMWDSNESQNVEDRELSKKKQKRREVKKKKRKTEREREREEIILFNHLKINRR